MRGVPTEGGSEPYFVRTTQRRASAPGTHPEDGCRRWPFFSSLLGGEIASHLQIPDGCRGQAPHARIRVLQQGSQAVDCPGIP